MVYNAEFNPLAAGTPAPSSEAVEPAYGDDPASDYRKRLNRWAIARLLSDRKPDVVARFRSRSDADGHLISFRQRFPSDKFLVIFDKQEQ